MKKIEELYERDEIIKGINEDKSEFSVDKLYAGQTDYKEAIVIITPNQSIPLPVYSSHAMVALNIFSVILKDFKMPRNPIDMHEKLMEYYQKHHIILVYIESNRVLNIMVPTITEKQGDNLKKFLRNMADKYEKKLNINIGDLSYVKLNDERIFGCIDDKVDPSLQILKPEFIIKDNKNSKDFER